MIQNWSEMIQNSCELETELGTRQVFVATRQSKASQGKSRQVKASQQVCKTGCWKCEWLFGSLACNKLKKTSTRSSSSWDTVNKRKNSQEMSRRYSGPSWRLREESYISAASWHWHRPPHFPLPQLRRRIATHSTNVQNAAEPQLPRRTSLEHIAALYWGKNGYIGPRIVVWWCGVVVACDRKV